MRVRSNIDLLFKDIIIPFVEIAIMLCLAYPICNKSGNIDFFLLWIIVGLPFGIKHMIMWLIPHNYGISGTIGVIGFDCIIGGIIGGFVVSFMVIKSIVAVIRILITIVMR